MSKIFNSFEDYWKQFGQFHNEIISNHSKMSENDFRSLCEKIWIDSRETIAKNYDVGYSDGWDDCETKYKPKS